MDLISNASVVTAIGAIAFVVSIITEMTKDIGFLKRIPTMLQVIVLSVALWIALYMGCCATGLYTYQWYMLIASIVAGFISAYVSSYGWEKLVEVFNRYKREE